MTTKILLVDDHAVLRDGLRSLLQAQGDFSVVGEASTGREAVELVKQLEPDVVVMDVRMPDLNGVDAARQAVAARPGMKVIALSGLSDDKSAVDMLRAGAVGFVAKESAFTELINAIRTVINHNVYFSPAVVARAASPQGTNGEFAGRALSVREREVLQLIAEGKSTKEIALELQVSSKTAETHRRNLMEKLGVDSIAEVIKHAIREGVVGL